MYFKMAGGTNRGFVLKNGSTNVAQIDGSGNFWGTSATFAGNLSVDGTGTLTGLTVSNASAPQLIAQYDGATRLQVSVAGSGVTTLATDNTANIDITNGLKVGGNVGIGGTPATGNHLVWLEHDHATGYALGMWNKNTGGQGIICDVNTVSSSKYLMRLRGNNGSNESFNVRADGSMNALGNATFAGTIGLPAGTASLPSLYWGTDTNTGIYHSNDNNIRMTINGTKAFELDASRNLHMAGSATFGGERLKTGEGTNVYQMLNGSKTGVAHDTWTTIAYAGHTHILEVKVWATTGGQRHRMSIFDVITNYGSNGVTTERETAGYAPDSPSVDNVSLRYNNSGYKIEVKVNVSDSSTSSTVSWAITGMSEISIYNA
jgi:hypothetical protein